MLPSFFSWWFARLAELLPKAWTNGAARPRAGIVVDVDSSQDLIVSLRNRDGQREPITLGAAARQGGRMMVLLRPPAGVVLVKSHTVSNCPAAAIGPTVAIRTCAYNPFSR